MHMADLSKGAATTIADASNWPELVTQAYEMWLSEAKPELEGRLGLDAGSLKDVALPPRVVRRPLAEQLAGRSTWRPSPMRACRWALSHVKEMQIYVRDSRVLTTGQKERALTMCRYCEQGTKCWNLMSRHWPEHADVVTEALAWLARCTVHILTGVHPYRQGVLRMLESWGCTLLELEQYWLLHERVERGKGWGQWSQKALSGGAAAAHRWSKISTLKELDKVECDTRGMPWTGDPLALLEQQRTQWASVWRARDHLSQSLDW
eukprot:6302894-Amphidinium_carterae.1